MSQSSAAQASQETAWDYTKYANYSKWGSDNEYRVHSGTFALPLAEDPPTNPEERANWSPVAVVKAHAPYAERVVTFDTKKRSGPPVIPSPESAGPFTFLGGAIHFDGPAVGGSGATFDWSVRGAYSYVMDVRFDPNDGFVLTGFPFPLATQVANKIQYQGQAPTEGPVAEAGEDVVTGYQQAQQINMQSPYWRYNTISYFPPQLLNADLVIGGLPPTV